MAINSVNVLFTHALADTALSAKQKEVLKASLVLFSEQGFDRTSTSDIAKKAGVSEGTVYKQFKTKEGILAAILKPFAQSVIPTAASEFVTMISSTSYPSLEEFLRHVVQNRMQFAKENKLQLKIFAQELLHNTELVQALEAEIKPKLIKQMGQVLEYYQKQGQLVAWPAVRIFRYVISVVFSYLVPYLLLELPLDVEEASQEAVEFLLGGLSPATK
ncbi:TetR/AcrR family transcriptional regulator [Liquorilactobacillus satsumensis]|uniref:Transcriptional regulator, TetR family n=1 Tax=Liquorilactobacillus satsumensis DSM 16230 = JCM 12392 TaxID=1423801 RepID=A0A0R1VA66_9LACO|nr:TetR/AcrR family transcriptional regulator [Liquorilactobacillus satsumensis]KRL98811.1 transcriptional regulator, TetR family [Liquorilactobacillus satsumensis DSM 16230 = JCM 12392]MCC7666358.1 TetR/AcrR family transcriptional regulator [Liquorilactobacillus satsumensis]MCP9312724.1 TetR/AcrR family transcriptional regulator [Liquorilactobacillus satsumensis]MCP9328010.1 TetR/AcrR family transcriptional regulator [Liquorilactobacillus satsumensis]MCP9358324.1 TetR/AcrR family transcriptio